MKSLEMNLVFECLAVLCFIYAICDVMVFLAQVNWMAKNPARKATAGLIKTVIASSIGVIFYYLSLYVK